MAPPPLTKKALENRYWVEMYVYSPIIQGQLKKIRPITLIVWVLGRIEKMPKTYFFKTNNSVKLVSICIFQGLFKNIGFRSVALATKKL